jgi:hypothetical protein
LLPQEARSYRARESSTSEGFVHILHGSIATLVAMLVSCGDQGFVRKDGGTGGVDRGQIQGRFCDPSGRSWLSSAMAYTNVVRDGVLQETRVSYSDRDGFWLLEDLPGELPYEVFVQHGSEILFDEEIYVPSGKTVRLSEPDCFDPLELKVAVITGDYDDFQLVIEQMGFENYTVYDGLVTGNNVCDVCEDNLLNFLLAPDDMAQFDIIMFNGGHIEEDIVYDIDDGNAGDADAIMGNIVAYVQGGGTIYASDWAYDEIEIGWPARIDFLGKDALPNDAEIGTPQTVAATISDSALAEWLGADDGRIDIEYDLSTWPAVTSVDASVSVHLQGDVDVQLGPVSDTVPASPLLVSFTDGDGKVVYTSFRVAANASSDMLLTLQYIMYSL